MSIVSSSYVTDAAAQIDGRIYVTESHVGSDGLTYRWLYLADASADKDALLTVHAARIAADLAAQEIEGILNGDPT